MIGLAWDCPCVHSVFSLKTPYLRSDQATVVLNANVAFLTLQEDDTLAKSFSYVSTLTSVGVVVLALILVRQNKRKDQDSAEQAV